MGYRVVLMHEPCTKIDKRSYDMIWYEDEDEELKVNPLKCWPNMINFVFLYKNSD